MRFLYQILLFILCFLTLTKGYSKSAQLSDNKYIYVLAVNTEKNTSDHGFIDTQNDSYQDALNPADLTSSQKSKFAIVAKDDKVDTPEEQDLIIDVLANDNENGSTFDPNTIDLDVSLAGIQTSISLTEGTFKVDAGMVTFSPEVDFNGTVNIDYTVDDNFGTTSNVAAIKVTVDPVNDQPIITGQTPASIAATEDVDFSLSTINLAITDPDNNTFSLIILPGTNYTFSGTTITPAPDYNGPLTVNVKVNDGSLDSDPFSVAIDVSVVNDKPDITGQTPSSLAATEDTDFTISLSDLTIVDPDNSTFSLTIFSGLNYTFSGSTITPNSDYNGPLSVNVKVNDGTQDSDPFAVSVTVASVNDAPIISSQTPAIISATEDQSFNLSTSNLVISDIDNSTFTLTVLAGMNYTFSGTIITPTTNYNGALTVNVKVSDGSADSAPFGVAVNVAAVNDVPNITGQTPASIAATEDESFNLSVSNLIISDPDDATFTLIILAGTNYTFSGTTITPAANYNGALTVNVRVNDGSANSATFGVSVNVGDVNNAPVITGQTPSPISATEDQSFSLSTSNLVISDPDNSSFTLTILSGTNYTFSGTTITPSLNYSGALTVNVKVNDGAVDSAPFGVAVNVAAVNDVPTITGQTPASIAATENQNFNLSVSNLIISDPDDVTFTLIILAGTNYTFSGTTITPAANYNGALTVNVRVNDGSANSATFGVAVNVGDVNNAPVITGQTPSPISATEDQSFSILTSNLVISDPDNSSFTLTILSGTNYTFSGTTITPSSNYSGALTVNVKVNDGTVDSAPFGVAVNVAAVNDVPTITSQTPASISATEDQSFNLSVSNLVISDPDDVTFSLIILAGTNYTFSGTTITPATNYNGALTVNVRVNDGSAISATFGVAVNVGAVNQVPIITSQNPSPLVTNEDQAITISLSNLIVTDPDNSFPSDFTLFVLSGTNYSASGNVITPAVNFSGVISVKVFVSDGNANSAIYNLQILVNAVNDVPVITGQQVLSVNEETPITLQLSNLTVTDSDDTYPTGFTLTVLPGTNYTFSGSTVTPTANFNGALTVNVKVNDGSIDSAPHNVLITVKPINDAPIITGQDAISINEDEPFTLNFTHLNVTDPDNTYPTGFSLLITAGTNYTVSGTTITPKPNFSGTLTVSVKVKDGTTESAPFNLQIQVQAVNDAPVITGQQALSVNEETPITIQLSNLTVTDPDDAYPTGFTLTISPGTNYNVTGNIITPDENFNGVLTVSVKVNDGLVDSPPRNIQITIKPVNDIPVFQSTPPTIAIVGETYTYNIEVTDVDGDALTITALTKPAWATLAIVSNGKVKLSGVPTAATAGSFAVKIQAKDPSSPAIEQLYNLLIDRRPVLTPISITTNEDVLFFFQSQNFTSAFVDADGNSIAAVKIIKLPKHGILKLSDVIVTENMEIPFTSITTLTYLPNQEYSGRDTLYWNASDGVISANEPVYSASNSYVSFVINPTNDAPFILSLETDTLKFEIGKDFVNVTSVFEVVDTDDSNLTNAEIGFKAENYKPYDDELTFVAEPNITGFFNNDSGILKLSGVASISEYNTVIRSIKYKYLQTERPVLETKTLYLTFSDGKSSSTTRERYIDLIYTFEDLEIVNGFTPNGDDVNDKWVVVKPGREEDLDASTLQIFSKEGVLVFESKGFKTNSLWDGMSKGKLVPAGSYFYTIEAIDSKLPSLKKLYKGVVNVLY